MNWHLADAFKQRSTGANAYLLHHQGALAPIHYHRARRSDKPSYEPDMNNVPSNKVQFLMSLNWINHDVTCLIVSKSNGKRVLYSDTPIFGTILL